VGQYLKIKMGRRGKKGYIHINRHTTKYYLFHKRECSYHNWVARMVAFLEFNKKVWPEPGEKEIEAFREATGWTKKRRPRL